MSEGDVGSAKFGGERRYKTSNWALNNSPGWVKSVKTSCGLLGITTWLSISQVHDSEPVLASILLGKFILSQKLIHAPTQDLCRIQTHVRYFWHSETFWHIKSPPSWQLQCHFPFLLPTPASL
jgi:hypothetical protein